MQQKTLFDERNRTNPLLPEVQVEFGDGLSITVEQDFRPRERLHEVIRDLCNRYAFQLGLLRAVFSDKISIQNDFIRYYIQQMGRNMAEPIQDRLDELIDETMELPDLVRRWSSSTLAGNTTTNHKTIEFPRNNSDSLWSSSRQFFNKTWNRYMKK